MLVPAGRLDGGLRLRGLKQAAARPITACPLPATLSIALRQHAGPPARPAVAIGETVAAGQVIGVAADVGALPVHAPCAGEVYDLREGPDPDPVYPPVLHVVLTTRPGARPDRWLPPLDAERETPERLRQRLHDAGIAGLGGATFPTAAKLAFARHCVILNGAECEPTIACDDRLLRERAESVLAGGRLLQRLCGAERLLLAVEDSMSEALAAITASDPAAFGAETVVVPSVYPQGGERQLIQALLGLEVPRGGLPRDLGVAVFNVGTAFAAWQAVNLGRPLTHRLVSISGPGVARAGVFEVALGTSVADLVAAAGGYTPAARRLLLGGPLMGRALADDSHALGKSGNSVLVLDGDNLRPAATAMPCIRCGACAEVCPSRLLPQQLLAFARAGDDRRLREFGLFDCIECGACDLVCPSSIALAASFRADKQRLFAADRAAELAAAARVRHDARRDRLAQEASERQAGNAEQQRRLGARAAVEAALAKARQKRGDGTL